MLLLEWVTSAQPQSDGRISSQSWNQTGLPLFSELPQSWKPAGAHQSLGKPSPLLCSNCVYYVSLNALNETLTIERVNGPPKSKHLSHI